MKPNNNRVQRFWDVMLYEFRKREEVVVFALYHDMRTLVAVSGRRESVETDSRRVVTSCHDL